MTRLPLTRVALVLVCITAESYAQSPPGARAPVEEPLYAIALEAGSLRAAAEVTEDGLFAFDAGAIFSYLGDTTDAFGREWQMVADPESWTLQRQWFVVAASADELRDRSGPVTLIKGIPAPGVPPERPDLDEEPAEDVDPDVVSLTPYDLYLASLRQPLEVSLEWWHNTVEVDADEVRLLGETLSVPAWAIPPQVVDEAISLLGGRDGLGPWPQEASFGALHVTSVLPLVFRRVEHGWESLGRLRAELPVLSLLSNSQLQLDPNLPAEATGFVLPCWQLVGGLDPRGLPAGRVDVPPPPPERLLAGARRDEDRYLGSFDLSTRLWPAATVDLAAPRRVAPSALPTGVMLEDANRRQAVYLEQRLPPAIARRLRGRELRLEVVARATPGPGGATSAATVGFEIEAGQLREAGSGAVGAIPATVSLVVTVPADADEIIVRLLPTDRSIAVGEAGQAIFDRVTLVPGDWPTELSPAPVALRRVRVDLYEATRRYTRASMAISNRDPSELSSTWRALARTQLDAELRRMILAEELDFEMDDRQVRIAWGEPSARHEGGVSRWDWSDRSATFDPSGGLIAWTEEAEDAELPVPRCLVSAAEQTLSLP